MSTYARTRRYRTSPVAAEDEKSRLALTSPTRDQEAPAALNDPGHNFGQIAVQPAPELEPQTKLRVSQRGDAHEQEADQVADTVLRMPEVDTAAASGDTTATHAMASQSSPFNTDVFMCSCGGQDIRSLDRTIKFRSVASLFAWTVA